MKHPDRDDFERCWPLLKPAILLYGDTHRKKHVWESIESGHSQLWCTELSAVVSSIKVWPTGMKEVIGWLAGGDIKGIQQLVPQIESWAKKRGCARAGILLGREGWARALDGYKPAGIQLMKEL